MAHTKAQRAVRGNRDSISKRLGIKVYGGQTVKSGNIIIRQRGTKVHGADGVIVSKDHTILASRNGVVRFFAKMGRQFVSVDPA